MNLKHLFVAVPTALCITPTTEARVSGCLLGNRANGEGFLGLAHSHRSRTGQPRTGHARLSE